MKKKSLLLYCLAFSLALLSLSSCRKTDNPDQAYMNVHLADGPVQYDAVYLDVQKVEINSDVSGWVSLSPLLPGVYNLLDFRNGMDTLLCKAGLPAGHVSQMRLVLGDSNSIVVDGNPYPLATPSAQQSGLKFNMQTDLVAGAAYDVWIDFDVAHSIVVKGTGDV